MLSAPQAVATKRSPAPRGIDLGAAPGVAQTPHFPVFSPSCQVGVGVGPSRSVSLRKDAIPGNGKTEILKSSALPFESDTPGFCLLW